MHTQLVECVCQYASDPSHPSHSSGGYTLPSAWVRHEGLLATALMRRKHWGFLYCFSMINTLVSGLKVIIGLLCPTQQLLHLQLFCHRTRKNVFLAPVDRRKKTVKSTQWTVKNKHCFSIFLWTLDNIKTHHLLYVLCIMILDSYEIHLIYFVLSF